MLCQRCQKREATRHESVLKDDGTWSEVHVCDPCAETGDLSVMTPASLVQALVESATALSGARPLAPGRACPKCGITYAEFRSKGRLGCPHDYEVFQGELLPLLERIHQGGVQHVGKSPAATDARSESDRAMIDLRRALSEAVQGERYEEAARLRDRIRRLEEAARAPAAKAAPAKGAPARGPAAKPASPRPAAAAPASSPAGPAPPEAPPAPAAPAAPAPPPPPAPPSASADPAAPPPPAPPAPKGSPPPAKPPARPRKGRPRKGKK
jgi:protein arginine kinase activator